MQYMLLLYSDESQDRQPQSEEEMAEYLAPWAAYSQALADAGVMRGGEALEPTSTATTLSPGQPEPVVTDGPFAETKEQLGGFYMLDCKDLDEALAWAGKCPILTFGGRVEVRPIMVFPDA